MSQRWSNCVISHAANARFIFVIILCVTLSNCSPKSVESQDPASFQLKYNMTDAIWSDYEWMNEPADAAITDSILTVTVDQGSDFFNNPEDSTIVGSAPYLHKKISGDFVAKSLIQPDFSSQWNAIAFMVYIDSLNWIKFAFENSDATGPSIVSVVTKGTSDDANGAILSNTDKVWLALARKGDIYSMHWSEDGEKYHMARLTAMPKSDTIRIGLEMQSPVGDKAVHRILFFDIEETSPDNLRTLQ